jgi:hypothetical protein
MNFESELTVQLLSYYLPFNRVKSISFQIVEANESSSLARQFQRRNRNLKQLESIRHRQDFGVGICLFFWARKIQKIKRNKNFKNKSHFAE